MSVEQLTASEQAVMTDISDTLTDLVNTSPTDRGLTVLSAVNRQPGKTYQEITCELIAKGARCFRNTNTFRNMYLKWIHNLYTYSDTAEVMYHSFPPHDAWLRLIVVYYKGVLEHYLSQLGVIQDYRTSIAAFHYNKTNNDNNAVINSITSFTDADLHDIIHAASDRVTSELCHSAIFMQCLRVLPEFLQSFRLASAIVSAVHGGTTADGGSAISTTAAAGGSKCAMAVFKSYEWLHCILVLYHGAMRLWSEGNNLISETTTTTNNNTNPSSHGKMMPDGISLAAAMGSATDVIKLSFTSSTEAVDALQFIVLEYGSKCSRDAFSRDHLLGLLKLHPSDNNNNSNTVSSATAGANKTAAVTPLPSEPPSLDREALRAIPAVYHMLRAAPEFIQHIVSSGGSEESSGSIGNIAMLHLFCWTTSDPSIEPTFDITPRKSYLHDVLVAALRPLLAQLFALHAPPRGGNQLTTNAAHQPQQAAATAATAPGATGGGADSNSIVNNMTAAQKVAEAAIVELAAIMTSQLVFTRQPRVKKWRTLKVGHQPQREHRLGQLCFTEAMTTALEELMVTALRGLTVSEEDTFPFVNFLMQTEGIYNVLTTRTEHGADAAASLQECKRLYCESVKKAFQAVYPKKASTLFVEPVVKAVDEYQRTRINNTGGGGGGGPSATQPTMRRPMPPPAGAARGGAAGGGAPRPQPPPTRYVINSEADLHSMLRLSGCIEDRAFFLTKYKDALFQRLLYRAPSPLSDDVIDNNKRTFERLTCEYLMGCLGDSEEMRSMKELYTNFTTEAFTPASSSSLLSSASPDGSSGVKIVVTTLDWRNTPTGFTEYLKLVQAAPATTTATTGTAAAAASFPEGLVPETNNGVLPLPSDRLPFPPDLWESMNGFQSSYQSQHKGKSARWLLADTCMVTFTLEFPQDQGRATSITTSVFIQQLFLAIAQYRRTGVSYSVLAARAGDGACTAEMIRKVLTGPLRDGLVVETQGTHVTLNYAYTRPAGSRGEYRYVPRPKPITFHVEEMDDAKRDQIGTHIIQVMKSVHEIHADALFSQVGEKLRFRFPLVRRMFKQTLDYLFERNYVERSESDPNVWIYKS